MQKAGVWHTILSARGKVKSKRLIAFALKYPEHFIFALDNVFADHWGEFYLTQMVYWKNALSNMPEEIAHRIAHGNAERLWKLSVAN